VSIGTAVLNVGTAVVNIGTAVVSIGTAVVSIGTAVVSIGTAIKGVDSLPLALAIRVRTQKTLNPSRGIWEPVVP
jgi:hypothetical protein